MTEPDRDADGALEREARTAAQGESERTPLLVLGGVMGTIAVVAGIVIVVALLLWWLT